MIDQAAAQGVMPITILLETMRAIWVEAHKDGGRDLAMMKEACGIASAAAVYVHPRLASYQAKVETISGVSDGALDLRLAAVLDSLNRLVVPEDEDEVPMLPAPSAADEAAE
jgi:hypothetical protein